MHSSFLHTHFSVKPWELQTTVNNETMNISIHTDGVELQAAPAAEALPRWSSTIILGLKVCFTRQYLRAARAERAPLSQAGTQFPPGKREIGIPKCFCAFNSCSSKKWFAPWAEHANHDVLLQHFKASKTTFQTICRVLTENAIFKWVLFTHQPVESRTCYGPDQSHGFGEAAQHLWMSFSCHWCSRWRNCLYRQF